MQMPARLNSAFDRAWEPRSFPMGAQLSLQTPLHICTLQLPHLYGSPCGHRRPLVPAPGSPTFCLQLNLWPLARPTPVQRHIPQLQSWDQEDFCLDQLSSLPHPLAPFGFAWTLPHGKSFPHPVRGTYTARPPSLITKRPTKRATSGFLLFPASQALPVSHL